MCWTERLDLDRAFLRHRDALLLVRERGRYVHLIKLAVEAKMRIAPKTLDDENVLFHPSVSRFRICDPAAVAEELKLLDPMAVDDVDGAAAAADPVESGAHLGGYLRRHDARMDSHHHFDCACAHGERGGERPSLEVGAKIALCNERIVETETFRLPDDVHGEVESLVPVGVGIVLVVRDCARHARFCSDHVGEGVQRPNFTSLRPARCAFPHVDQQVPCPSSQAVTCRRLLC